MSKLALHLHTPEPWTRELAGQVNHRFCKQLFFSDLTDYYPLLWTVARLMLPGLDAQEATYWRQGVYGVDDYIDAVDSAYTEDRLDTLYGEEHRVGHFELINEPVYGNYAELQRLVDFECCAALRYNYYNRRVLLGSFPPGRPNVNDKTELEILRPLFDVACKPLNGLALHHYGHPKLGDDPYWFAMRHKALIDALNAATPPIPVPPLWITEFGADYWRRWYPNIEAYLDELAWADKELAECTEVQAAFIYTSALQPQDRAAWGDFELGEADIRKLAERIGEHGQS